VHHVALSPDGQLAATAALDFKIHIWDLKTGMRRGTLAVPRYGINDLVFSPDGQALLFCGQAGVFSLCALAGGKELARFEGHTDAVECVAFSRDGRLVVSGSKDQTIRIWEARTGKVRKRFQGHTERIMAVAFSSDSKQVFSASFDGSL